MRTIKFRAWDSDINKMFLPENIGRIHFYPEAKGITTITKHGDGVSINFKLMQFTGLLDKNGKEIYEGDIVKTSHSVITIGIIAYWDVYHSYEIESLDRNHCISDKYDWSDIEIIGNIYEHPGQIENNPG